MERILVGSESEVLIGRTIPRPVLPAGTGRRRVAILCQPGATGAAEHIETLLVSEGLEVHSRALPDGDAVKTLSVAGDTYEWLAGVGVGRSDTILGVGGGAITDFAGFVGGTWLRGVETVYYSTTLLGAVDAAIGGKTGLNLLGKNLVGLFRHPARVIINVEDIAALPPHLLREGFAEAIKAGFIADLDLLELVERDAGSADLEEVIVRAVRVKAAVVSEDFREAGRRAILNYGHTIGHGVEIAAGLRHGDAIAIGMTAAAAVGERRLGFKGAARQRRILESLGLPVTAPSVDRDHLLRLIGLDKKRDATGLRMVLLEDFGRPVVEYVTAGDLDAAFGAVGL